jgi:hypothetical protein
VEEITCENAPIGGATGRTPAKKYTIRCKDAYWAMLFRWRERGRGLQYFVQATCVFDGRRESIATEYRAEGEELLKAGRGRGVKSEEGRRSRGRI